VTAPVRFRDAVNEGGRVQSACSSTPAMMSGRTAAIREEYSWRVGCKRGEKKRRRVVGSGGGALGASPLLDAVTCATEAAFFFPPFLLATWTQDVLDNAVECESTVVLWERARSQLGAVGVLIGVWLGLFWVRVFRSPINGGGNRVRIFAGKPFSVSIPLSGHPYWGVLIIDSEGRETGYQSFLSGRLG